MSIQLPTWIGWALWGLIGLSTLLALHALLWDWLRRARRPEVRRCPRCWYDMSAGGMTCPECGRTARSERAMHYARRRWSMVVIALVLALSSLWSLFLTRATYRQLARLSPTWLLLEIAEDPCGPITLTPVGRPDLTFEGEFRVELWRRSFNGDLSLAESRSLAARQFANPRWDVLTLETRPRWPVGVPLWAKVTSSFRGARDRDLVASSPWNGGDHYTALQSAVFVMPNRSFTNGWFEIPSPQPENPVLVNLGTPPPVAREATFAGVISEGKDEVYTHIARAPITIVSTIDDAITPDTSGFLDQSVRSIVESYLCLSPDGEYITLPPLLIEANTAAVALRVEFVRDNTPIAQSSILIAPQPGPEGGRIVGGIRDYSHIWARLTGPGVPLENTNGLKVRVSSDPELALRQFDATSYWKGEFSFDFVPHDWPNESPAER
ncbi:MAG: hypothetical protein U0638_11535 [Phycisphaerales bacterium]